MSLIHSQPERYKTQIPSDDEMIVFHKIATSRELVILEELEKGFTAQAVADRKIIFSESDRNKGKPVTSHTIRILVKNLTGYSPSSIRLHGMIERKKIKKT